MVRPQERLQIALVVRAAGAQWSNVIYFMGFIEQVVAALRVARIDTATCAAAILFAWTGVQRRRLAAVGAAVCSAPRLGMRWRGGGQGGGEPHLG